MGIDMLRNLASRIIRGVLGRLSGGARYQISDQGFHGDIYLIELTDVALKSASHFVETGANVGSTLRHVAQRHSDVRCLSCEPDAKAFALALEYTETLPNVKIYNMASQTFINEVLDEPELLGGHPVFWLDAHGYGFEWPLKDEVEFITSRFARGRLLIDDFQVPGLPEFGYDRYQGHVCTIDYIQGAMDPQHTYRLTYPAYTDRTSRHHALRGWVLIEFGYPEPLPLPEALQARISQTEKSLP